MMKITTAKTAGFCYGVDRAVETVRNEVLKKDRPVFTYGPIIHNAVVVKEFESMGVRVISSEDEIPIARGGTVVIRSHGVSRRVMEKIKESGADIVDATCPFVKKIQMIAASDSRAGRIVVIAGDEKHPEVEGIIGWAEGPCYAVKNCEDFDALGLDKNIAVTVVSQTTFNFYKFKDLVEILEKRDYDIKVENTICSATEKRQTEAAQIAETVDAMIVIGDRHSSNTQKLYDICKHLCKHTYFIETLFDLEPENFQSFCHVGITAGASTPKKIIEEVQNTMSENMTFEQLLDGSIKTIRNGEVVEGTVFDVKDDVIVLDIGYKADGLLPKNEYSSDPAVDLHEAVKVGDKMTVKVLKVNDGDGQVLLTHKRLASDKVSEKIKEAFENKEVLTAKVDAALNGGLSVIYDGTKVFIPASLVSDTFERDLKKFVGQDIEFVIIEFDPRRRRIIGNRKQLIVEKKSKLQEELFSRINVGDVVSGTVKNITDFGAFVDLGGADGLLHISEMSWGRVDNPRNLLKVGDQLDVLIKDIRDKKIALSLKFADKNPWINAGDKYTVGSVVEGKVARMTDFGAFVELETGVDALLHVSQISRTRVEKPADVLTIGQEVTVKVVDCNLDDKKISVSMKALEKPAPKAEAEEAAEETAEAAADTAEETAEAVAETAEAVEEAVEEKTE